MRFPSTSRRGQTLVESALALVVFLVLIAGIIDVGQLMFTHTSLVDRVRAALRWAVVRPYDETAIRNMVLYARPVPGQGAVFPGLAAENVVVERVGDALRISVVNYHYRFLSPWMAGVASPHTLVESLPVEYQP